MLKKKSLCDGRGLNWPRGVESACWARLPDAQTLPFACPASDVCMGISVDLSVYC